MVTVAVFLVGQPRYISGKSYRSIKKHLIDKYDCEFYCHYWFDDKNPLHQANWCGKLPEIICHADTDKIIKNLYVPIAYSFDKPIAKEPILEKYSEFEKSKYDTSYNLYSYYTSMKLCLNVYKTNKAKQNYDFYIKLRYDGVLDGVPDLHNYEYDNNSIIVSANHKDLDLIDCNTFICKDEVTFMKAMSISDYFDILCKTCYINDEQMFWCYFKMLNISIEKISSLRTMLIQELNYDMS
jgi:hypothetical protein